MYVIKTEAAGAGAVLHSYRSRHSLKPCLQNKNRKGGGRPPSCKKKTKYQSELTFGQKLAAGVEAVHRFGIEVDEETGKWLSLGADAPDQNGPSSVWWL